LPLVANDNPPLLPLFPYFVDYVQNKGIRAGRRGYIQATKGTFENKGFKILERRNKKNSTFFTAHLMGINVSSGLYVGRKQKTIRNHKNFLKKIALLFGNSNKKCYLCSIKNNYRE
jgi:hypothetical protein